MADGFGLGSRVRIGVPIAMRSSDAPQGIGIVTDMDGDRRQIRWPDGSWSWHGVWVLEEGRSSEERAEWERLVSDDEVAHDREMAAALDRLAESVTRISEQFETLMAAMAATCNTLGAVLAQVIDTLSPVLAQVMDPPQRRCSVPTCQDPDCTGEED